MAGLLPLLVVACSDSDSGPSAQEVAWKTSGHADSTAEAFKHWDAEGEIPASCARCHSTPGFRDYLGDDGSTAFQVDGPAKTGTVIGCDACHSDAAKTLSEVRFPSGAVVTGLGPEARCMTCHQGREGTDTVDAAIDASGADPDVVSTALGFKNVHYFAAGATLNGGRARGGYQYADKVYDWRFRHVPGKDSCIECHDPHSLKVDVASCASCHPGVTTTADLANIRAMSSLAVDYDGDGDRTEGIAGEIDGLRAALYTAIQGYATAQGNDAICYNGASHPYFFIDPNADGDCADGTSKYVEWTPRLLRATFNYQFSKKDPGAFAHNAKYIIQLLFDSIADLNQGIAAANRIDMSDMHRDDEGHFEGSAEPARHWDHEAAGVPLGCAKCHSGSAGFLEYLSTGTNSAVAEPGNGLDCATCHTSFPATKDQPNLVQVASVKFPNKTVTPDSSLTAPSFICMTCHSGREAKSTVDDAIATAAAPDPDTVSTALKFRNVHYLPAAAVLLGSDAAVGYEYEGNAYSSRSTHAAGIDCNFCHSGSATKHTFEVSDNLAACKMCHGGNNLTSVYGIRVSTADFDGDGNNAEPLRDELAGLSARLLAAMQSYSTGKGGLICYDGHTYPYFLKTSDTCANASGGYANWTEKLLKAAYNYQLAQKEPGAWAHNMKYMSQLLYDSIVDLGGSTAGITRP